jgi:hypothetical protein
MPKIIAATLAALILSAGTAVGMHAYDVRDADHSAVTNYNDGFITGACAASPTVAQATYGFTCDEWN